MTNNQGTPVADDENSLKSSPRGRVLLEDFLLREKITHFDHERIPERVVHARGTAAHGYFELTSSLADVSKAGIFNLSKRLKGRNRSSSRITIPYALAESLCESARPCVWIFTSALISGLFVRSSASIRSGVFADPGYGITGSLCLRQALTLVTV